MTDFRDPQWLEVPSGRLAYERSGAGRPIVFLHAGIADRRMWGRELTRNAHHATVVGYDRRGFGQSRPPTAEYSDVGDLRALLHHLGLGPAMLVGCSMGGALAIDYAVEHPEDVRALLLVSPGFSGWGPSVDPEGQPTYDADMARSAPISGAWKAGRAEEAIELLRQYWTSATTGASEQLVREMLRTNAAEAFEDRSARLARPIAPPAIDRVGALRIPTSVLYGDRDEPTCEYISRRVAKSIPGARFVPIPGADHLVNLSQPARFDAALDQLRSP